MQPTPAIVLSILANLAACFFLFRTPITTPWHLRTLLVGWGAFCAAASVGYVLAASVIAGAGFEVYRPRFEWRTLAPHFAVGLADARMGDRATQLAVWLARLFSPAAAAAAMMYYRPEWSLAPVLGWLYLVRPFSGGSPARIRVIALRGLKSDSQRKFIFEPNTTLLASWRAAWRTAQVRLVGAALGHSVLWLVTVLVWLEKWSGASAFDWRTFVAQNFSWQVWLAFSCWMAGALVVWLAIGAGAGIAGPWRRLRHAVQMAWLRWRPHRREGLAPDEVVALVGRSPLFRHLKPETRDRIARRMAFRTVSAGTVLCGFEDEPPEVGLIVTGRVRLFRRLKAGRRDALNCVEEGEIFGAHRMLDPSATTRWRRR